MKINKLLGIFVVCCILITWINFFDNFHISTLVKGKANEINKLLEALSISYIAGFIFYYLVVYLKEEKDKEHIMPFIANHTYFLINQVRLFNSLLKREAGIDSLPLNLDMGLFKEGDYPTEADWGEIIKIDLNARNNVPTTSLRGRSEIPTFLTIIQKEVNFIDERVNHILTKLQFVEPEYIRILSNITDCKFHRQMKSRGNVNYTVVYSPLKNLETYADTFKEYFNFIKTLENYSAKNLKQFVDDRRLLGEQPNTL